MRKIHANEHVFRRIPGLRMSPVAAYHLQHKSWFPSPSLPVSHSSCLQTVARLCQRTDGLFCGTATGRKNLTELRHRAGFSSNAGVKTFDQFLYKACSIPFSFSMDTNFCQSLQALCLNSLNSVEFQSEGGRVRDQAENNNTQRAEKTHQEKKERKLPLDRKNATICCLLSGCHADQLRMSV